MVHYMTKKAKSWDYMYNFGNTVATPIYVCLITLGISAFLDAKLGAMYTIIYFGILLLGIMCFLHHITKKSFQVYCFYQDYIAIVNSENTKTSSKNQEI